MTLEKFLYYWELPQNLLGKLILKCTKATLVDTKFIRGFYYAPKLHYDISLGNYIFITDLYNPNIRKHGYGHTIQSIRWGATYLLVIGIPSLFGNLWKKIFHKDSLWYYNLPWEKNADKLGGVVR